MLAGVNALRRRFDPLARFGIDSGCASSMPAHLCRLAALADRDGDLIERRIRGNKYYRIRNVDPVRVNQSRPWTQGLVRNFRRHLDSWGL